MNFIISLDCELNWGNHKFPRKNPEKFKTTKILYPHIMDILNNRSMKATWAFVGAMVDPVFWNTGEFRAYFSEIGIHSNEQTLLDNYSYTEVFSDINFQGHEIAGHSYFHLYTDETISNKQKFKLDSERLISCLSEQTGSRPISYVFPRNQAAPWAIREVLDAGFKVFRDEKNVMNKGMATFKRAYRIMDNFYPMNSINDFFSKESTEARPTQEVTRFLRFFNNETLNALYQKRIASEAHYCFQQGINYHIWFHPHNLAENPTVLLARLDDTLKRLEEICKTYEVVPATMKSANLR